MFKVFDFWKVKKIKVKRQRDQTKYLISKNDRFALKGKILLIIFILLVPSLSCSGSPGVVPSADGTLISYEVYGDGDTSLVFVHGWSCDSRYWRYQVSFFSRDHRVVLLDLAGHGHSGSTRKKYTMRSFGEDVKAVIDAEGLKKVILVGHSMGGFVIAETARLIPGRILGLVGVDTLEDVGYPLTREELKQMVSPFRKDFKNSVRQFTEGMFFSETDPDIREWIIKDMSAAHQDIAISSMEEMMSLFVSGESAAIFEEIKIPVVTVMGSLWPVNFEGNRKHMHSFDAIVLQNADHFLMIDKPEEFNRALVSAVEFILRDLKKESR